MKKLKIFTIGFFLIFGNCIYHNVKTPGTSGNETVYNFNSDDFQILGTVESTGIVKTYGFMVSRGGKGYGELLDKAKAMGGDDIINYRFEAQVQSVLLFIYQKVKWKSHATVIKYKNKVLN